jgi:UDP-N-acetylglucosamine:LPS N-acetylglucosamine transferase
LPRLGLYDDRPLSVLFIGAGMGAGHMGAAREMARRAMERGHHAGLRDLLDAFPGPLANGWRRLYLAQLRRAPESYERSYQLYYGEPAWWDSYVAAQRLVAGGRVKRWIRRHRPDVIVSTYNFATLMLGSMKMTGDIDVPVVNFLTDFGVHPRSVHPAADLNLAVHEVAAESARMLVRGPVVATGPAVHPRFSLPAAGALDAKLTLGIDLDRPLVVVVAGSWGVGAGLEHTVALLLADGYQVLTVCGGDERLRQRLIQQRLGHACGWTDQMPAILAAADVVVENAGGLTAFEALALGVPIISYRPIPGHGRDNVRAMVVAGVTSSPDSAAELLAAVSDLVRDTPRRRRQVQAGLAMFREDPVDRVMALAAARRSRDWRVAVS